MTNSIQIEEVERKFYLHALHYEDNYHDKKTNDVAMYLSFIIIFQKLVAVY